MVPNSLPYALFVLLVFAAYWLMAPAALHSHVLLAASFGLSLYLFPVHTLLILAVSSAVYLAGELIAAGEPGGGKAVFVFSVSGVLGLLAYYKYSPLLLQTFNQIGQWAGNPARLDLPEQAVPMGISFFTFRFIHYLVEVKRGGIPDRGYFKFLLYTFFFPIMPAGPIERYGRFDSQRREIRRFQWENVAEGLPRILLGLFKKVVLADSIAFLAGDLSKPGLDGAAYLAAVYSYAFKIYFDFAGYSDIAIGTGRLFGYRVMENFSAPYLQRNISLFWKCWHMSLTGWFRDYLFIPLGGSRGTLGRTILNTLIVMMATGIWHGAAWHFAAWGLYHAAGLVALRLYNLWAAVYLSEKFRRSRTAAVLSTVLTFHFAAFGWVFFVNDVGQSLHVLGAIFHLN
ncbi:MAG: MBOAT family protein [Peptococcaceae bacterium]|nr:MBOAT family protein [Peptococcaceae bacterium]